MGSEDVTCLIKALIHVNFDSRLPTNFSVKPGLSFHLKFKGISHPAIIEKCDLPIGIGSSGEVVVKFAALKEEEPIVLTGVPLKFVGGIDLVFAEGRVLEV
jgi:hypothetical protein